MSLCSSLNPASISHIWSLAGKRRGLSVDLSQQDKTVSILNIIYTLKDFAWQSQASHRLVHIYAEALITRSYLLRSWAGITLK